MTDLVDDNSKNTAPAGNVNPVVAPEIAPPVTMTPTTAGDVSAPNTLAVVPEQNINTPTAFSTIAAGSVGAPTAFSTVTAGDVAAPNVLGAVTAGDVAAPVEFTPVTAQHINRVLTPLIDLNFNSESYGINGVTQSFTDAVNYSRASSATYVETYKDALGRENERITTVGANVPRFEKDGYLTEGASTNIALRSEEFNSASWSKTNATVTANAGLAPDLTNTADLLVDDTGTTTHQIFQTLSLSADVTYTYSIYAKANTLSQIAISPNSKGGTVPVIIFDLSTGEVSAPQLGATGSIKKLGNDGWYRCSVTLNVGSGGTQDNVRIRLAKNDSINFTGTGTGSVFIWGAQVEALGGASSYIKTEGAAVSRAADVMTRPISIGRGNLSVRGKSLRREPSTGAFLSTLNINVQNYVGLAETLNNIQRALIISNNSTQVAVQSADKNWSTTSDASINFATNNVQVYFDDTDLQESSSAIVPTVSTLRIGDLVGNTPFYGHIEYVKVFDTALTANEVKAL